MRLNCAPRSQDSQRSWQLGRSGPAPPGLRGAAGTGHQLFGGSYGGRSLGAPPIASHPARLPRPERCRERASSARRGRGFPLLLSPGLPREVQKRAAPLPPRHGGYAPKCAGGLLAQPARILGLKSFGCCCRESGAAPPARGCCCSPPAPRSRPRRQELLLGAGCEDSPAAACRWDLPALPPFLHFLTTRCLS